MKHMPWLIIGTIVGTIVGCNAHTGYNHGWEEEAWELLRPLYGAGAGLVVGLLIDLAFAVQRRQKK